MACKASHCRQTNIKLPFKFDIGKYIGKNINDFDAVDWLYQLQIRQSIRAYIDDPNMQSISYNYYLKIIEQNEIIPVSDDENKLMRYNIKNLNHCHLSKSGESTVCFLTRAEAYKFHGTLKLDDKERISHEAYKEFHPFTLEALLNSKKVNCSSSDDSKKYHSEPFDFFIKDKKMDYSHPYSKYRYGDRIHLTINLAASNTKIIEDLKEILKEAREQGNTYLNKKHKKCLKKIKESIITEATFNGWIKNRILAYIDLIFLAFFYKIELTDEQSAEIIYPEKDNNDVIKDTLRPLAQYLTGQEALNKLLLYCKRQKPKKNKQHR